MADAPATTDSKDKNSTAVATTPPPSLADTLRSKVASSNLASENYKKAVDAADAAQKATDAANAATKAAAAANDAATKAQDAAKQAQAEAEKAIQALQGAKS